MSLDSLHLNCDLLSFQFDLSSLSFRFILLSNSGSCTGSLIPVINFKVSLELIYFLTLFNKSVMFFRWFLERDNCNSHFFSPLIKNYTIFVIHISNISNAFKLKCEIYFCKDSSYHCMTPKRLVFFGFLLLAKSVINYYINSWNN